jgi:hypothetical protein
MSAAPLDARSAACLGPLAAPQAERDGDGLLLIDAATGEPMQANGVMLGWLADAAFAAALRASGPSTTEIKVEMAGGKREFALL